MKERGDLFVFYDYHRSIFWLLCTQSPWLNTHGLGNVQGKSHVQYQIEGYTHVIWVNGYFFHSR